MFISADNIKKRAFRTALFYLVIAAFCGVFSAVYEHFSHGIYSCNMIYLFAYPLAGGALPYFVLALSGGRFYPRRVPLNLYNSGIATLSVGSAVKGVLEIYGTDSALQPIYVAAGICLLLAALVLYFVGIAAGRYPVSENG